MSHLPFDSDATTMGGPDHAFEPTQWTAIFSLPSASPVQRREMQGAILDRYWKPVYCYLRRKGHGSEDAKDLTQGFFCDVLLGRDLLAQADQHRGRFRSLLLTALDRYTTDQWRKAHAGKRAPTELLLSFSTAADEALPEPADTSTPQEAFHRAWAIELLQEALGETKSACLLRGQEVHWRIFDQRFLQPILTGAEPASLASLCGQNGVGSEKAASNMAVTVKRSLADILRRKVRRWVCDEQDVEEEIRDLMDVLSRRGSRGGETSASDTTVL